MIRAKTAPAYKQPELVETGDRTWSRLFMGIEAAGKYCIDVIEECRFHDSKIVEHWGVFDCFALLQQVNSGQKLVYRLGGEIIGEY